jgi:mycothiol system anti-sigma-R factor
VSCGKPHETDCRDVLEKVYEFLDAELSDGDIRTIRQHLDECAPCLKQFDLEDALKALVRRSCRDHAPAELRVRIMTRITEVRLQMDGSEPLI